jgi:hypothetical protein
VSPVLRSGQVVVVRGAEKPESLGEDLQHAFGEDQTFLLRLGLEDAKDHVLLAQARRARQIQGAGDLGQFADALFFKLGDSHGNRRNRRGNPREQIILD